MQAADPLFSSPAMNAVFTAEAHVQAMLTFEAALARAEARAGLLPEPAADAIAAACEVERYDVPELYASASSAGTLAIPLVKALTEQVDSEAARYVHLGATSQDAIDSAHMLQIRAGLGILESSLLAVADACADLARRHRATPMAGRTLLQHALPITFGLKAARWLAMTTRQVQRLRELHGRVLVVQFGGAVGTLASLGSSGIQVLELLAEELELGVPDLPWHTERDRIAEIAAAVGIVAGAVAKIAGDIALLTQTELGELAEASAEGKGGSSTLPHKRNPVDVTFARAAAQLALGNVAVILAAMAQEHERAAGSWQAEWAALPSLFCYTAGAVERVRTALVGLEIDAERMRANLELTNGLLMAESLSTALALHIDRPAAQRIVQMACEQARAGGNSLLAVALAAPDISGRLSATQIQQALDPTGYLGSADAFIDRALAGYQRLHAETEKS